MTWTNHIADFYLEIGIGSLVLVTILVLIWIWRRKHPEAYHSGPVLAAGTS